MLRLLAASRTFARPLVFSSRKIRAFSTVPSQGDVENSRAKKWICGYENIEELETAPENVQRIFSLDNANKYEQRKSIDQEIKDKYEGYSQRAVAELTLKINTLERHMQEKPKDKHNKVFLLWLIDQRKKKLKHLKTKDFQGYIELLRELDIPEVESPHSKWNKYKFRKFKLGVEVKEKRSFLDRKIIT